MDKSFDFGALLKTHERKHKNKPTQFVSVAGGIKKRLENISKHRKSNRLSSFDCNRNLPQSSKVDDIPVVIPEALNKVEYRRQQLENWKKEKDKKKKELAAQKKKPFVAGVPHNPLSFVPLPLPPRKGMPSTSSIVTRSQTRSQITANKSKTTRPGQPLQSFAPKNATFRAPRIENLNEFPLLSVDNTKNSNVKTVVFQPVIHNKAESLAKQYTSRSRTSNKTLESRMTRSTARVLKDNCNNTKPVLKSSLKCVQNSSSSENEMQAMSSIDDDVTSAAKSSSSEKENKYFSSSTDTESAARSLQSSSSSELEIEKQPDNIGKSRKSLVAPPKSVTPRKSVRKSRLSSQNDGRLHTPKNRIPKSESSSEEKLRSPKTPQDTSTMEEQSGSKMKISPYVTVSRGKANARKEMKQKLKQGLLDEDASNMDDVAHFRRQLQSEIKRMTERCEIWDKIYERVALPEPVQELVLEAVGQARLLMSQKMQQFASLVEKCARPEIGDELVTPTDLQGFWDVVFMQVVNVDLRFKKLEELKDRNWSDEAPTPELSKTKPAVKPSIKPAAKPTVKSKATSGTSRLREMIAAARKTKQQTLQSTSEDKTFEAGFFCVRSPIRSAPSTPRTPSTPNNNSLLKAVLSHEAKKASASKNCASFAILRASIHSKNVEYDGVKPLMLTPTSQVNLYATPSRSILKQTQDNTEKKTGTKSVKVVLFENSDSEVDENSVPNDNVVQEVNTDIEMSKDINKDTNLEDKKYTRRLTRQNACDFTPKSVPKTRNRKSKQTPKKADELPIRGTKNEIEETENNVEEETPKHKNSVTSTNSTPIVKKGRRTKSMLASQETEPRPVRSCTKKNIQKIDISVVEQKQTPKRSSRRRKTAGFIE